MRFEHQISITSETAVGSTSLFNALQKLLDGEPYRWVSGGGLMRQRAEGFGMGIEEFAKHARLHPEEGHDKWLDETIARKAREDWMICEGRLPHFFMPGAFKVWITCEMERRVTRRYADLKHIPGILISDVWRDIRERDENDRVRYEALYPGCLWTEDKFDLVLRTDTTSPDDLAVQVLEAHKAWLEELVAA